MVLLSKRASLVSVLLLPSLLWQSALRAQNSPPPVPITVRLTSRVASSVNRKGDQISAHVIAPPQFAGGTVEGIVKDANASGKINKTSKLTLQFTQLIVNGRQAAIQADVVGFRNSKGQANVDEEGNVIRKSTGMGKMALFSALGAAAGAGIGAANGNAGKGAAIGAGAGAVAGLLLVSFGTKAPDIRFDAGTELYLSVSPVTR